MKRKVFYIPGFDPRSEAHYKKLLLSQFPELKQSLTLNEKSRIVFEKDELVIDYEILSWHSQVRQNWASSAFQNLENVYTIFKESLFKGAYFRLYEVSKKAAFQKPFISYIFALWFVLFAIGLYKVAEALIDFNVYGSVLLPIAFVVFNILVYYLLEKFNLFWVVRVMNFFVVYANKESPSIADVEKKFKLIIEQALNDSQFDEVVLIGHSVGTILCLSVFADLVAEKKDNHLTVITLGHCVTGVNMIKSSQWYLQKMLLLAGRKALWVDVAAGKDAVAFYKINPAHFDEAKPNLSISAGFHRVFNKTFYGALKWNFYAVHFLYLNKPDFPEKSVFNFSKLLFDKDLVVSLRDASQNYKKVNN